MPPSHFSAEEWARLNNAERIRQCRRMADEATARQNGIV
jgi:hypothetical protein